MNIATYNILKGGAKRCHWQRLVEDYEVDLLFVQESYPHDEHFPPLLYPQFRNRSIWANASPNKWGSGIFSTSGVLSRITLPQYDGWVVGASIQSPDWHFDGDEILAFSLHAPHGEGRYAGQVNRILDMIAPLIDGRDVIIAGDFNLTISHFADEPIDKNNLAIQQRLTEEFGLMNCWMQANPDEPPHQTLRWTRNRATRYHCDGVFVPRK